MVWNFLFSFVAQNADYLLYLLSGLEVGAALPAGMAVAGLAMLAVNGLLVSGKEVESWKVKS